MKNPYKSTQYSTSHRLKWLNLVQSLQTLKQILAQLPCFINRRNEVKKSNKYFNLKCSPTAMLLLHFLSIYYLNRDSKEVSFSSNQNIWVTKYTISMNFISLWLGLPWWYNGWEAVCLCRGHGFDPWSGKISCAKKQLSPWVTTTETTCCNSWSPGTQSLCSATREASTVTSQCITAREWTLLTATRESPSTAMKTQHSQK